MWQVLLSIPGTPIKLYGYGFMVCLAFLGGLLMAQWRAKRERLDPDLVADMALWIFVGGVVGARAFYVFQYWGTRIHSLGEAFEIWNGGIVLYGSIIGGFLAFLAFRRVREFPLLATCDALAPSIALGIGIGRIGCFLNGCCYGDMTSLPVGVCFPAYSPPWVDQVQRGVIESTQSHSLAVQPTQLYSAFDGLLLCLLLTAYYPLRKRDGEVMALLMVTYPVTRFLIEWLRNDEGSFFAGLTISQNISLGIFALGLINWAWLRRRPLTRFADQPSAHDHDPATPDNPT